jgi:hypothetical protein
MNSPDICKCTKPTWRNDPQTGVLFCTTCEKPHQLPAPDPVKDTLVAEPAKTEAPVDAPIEDQDQQTFFQMFDRIASALERIAIQLEANSPKPTDAVIATDFKTEVTDHATSE